MLAQKNYDCNNNTKLLMQLLSKYHHNCNLKIASLKAKTFNIIYKSHPVVKKLFRISSWNIIGLMHILRTMIHLVNIAWIINLIKYLKLFFQNNPIINYPGGFDLVDTFQNSQHILKIIGHFSRYLSLFSLKSMKM